MTLNQAVIICGITVVPTLSEGTKPQLSFELTDLPMVKGSKNKSTGEVPMVSQSLSLRAISAPSAYLAKTGRPDSFYEMVATDWIEQTNQDLAKKLVTLGESPLAFHKSISQLVDSMEEETESVSAADPNNILAQFFAATLGKTVVEVDGVETLVHEQIPTVENFREVFEAKMSTITPEDITAIVDLLNSKAEKNGRKDSGQICWRAKKAPKTVEAPEPASV